MYTYVQLLGDLRWLCSEERSGVQLLSDQSRHSLRKRRRGAAIVG